MAGKIGVIGAGTMGAGIAQSAATAGFQVLITDHQLQAVESAIARIGASIDRSAASSDVAAETRARLHPVAALEQLAACDLVIEAIIEDEAAKATLFSQLGAVIPAGTMVATNTSCLSVSTLARSLPAPQRFVGLHYFFPAAINPLLEVIAGELTGETAMTAAFAFARATGKQPIRCRDVYGFAVNRFFVPYVNEAIRLTDEGFAAADVERVARAVFGTKAGPFKVMDLTKPEIALHAMRTLEKLGAFYAPSPTLAAKVAAGGLWNVAETEDGAGPQDTAIRDRLLGAVFHAVQDELGQRVASGEDIDLGARIGLRWQMQPLATMATMGAEEVARMVKTAAGAFI